MKPGEARDVQTYIPDLNLVCTTHLQARATEMIELGRNTRRKLLRVEETVSNPEGKTVPELNATLWVDSGGAYFRIYPYQLTKQALKSVNRSGQPVTFYLHPWELDPEHPRIDLPRRIALTHYFNLGATERRFRKLLRDFEFAPMRDVLNIN